MKTEGGASPGVPIRVLILEDRPEDVALIVRELERAGFGVSWEATCSEAGYTELLSSAESFDIVISDYKMPMFDASRALEILVGRGLDTPFIVVTGTISEEVAVRCMKSGAADYLLKDRLARLGQAVENALAAATLRRAKQRAETALARSESFNRNLVERAPLGILYLDSEGRITYENPAMKRMMGLKEGEDVRLLGMRLGDLEPVIDAGGVELLRRVIAGEVLSGEHVRYTSLAGATVDLELHASAFHDESGSLQGVIVMASNITERKLLQEQLLQAQKMEAIGQLAGGVAHDFNNLLSPILGYADMALLELDPGTPIIEEIREIRDAAQRASDLTRRLLAFSRKQLPQRALIDLNAIVTDFARMLERLIGENVLLRSELETHDPVLTVADTSQVHQVLMNLVLNARDAMPDGGELIIRTGVEHLEKNAQISHPPCASGRFAYLSVEDTGLGMDEQTLGRVFEPFYTTKARTGGTGLGLPTVFWIVRQHEGCIDIRSTPGRGSTFTVFLPAAEEDRARPEAPSESEPLPRGSETVLVVEDEPAVGRLVRAALSAGGYRVLYASGPGKAIEAFRGLQPGQTVGLLVSDVAMPGMDGRELFDKLRDEGGPSKAVFMSGYPLEPELFRYDPGQLVVRLLRKPFSVRTLLQTVREALDA
ncbi:response regulator [Candidatus Fermentibacterales bacterium]|nr:response regulator [Candidatus Fermentibacterales bacterium]